MGRPGTLAAHCGDGMSLGEICPDKLCARRGVARAGAPSMLASRPPGGPPAAASRPASDGRGVCAEKILEEAGLRRTSEDGRQRQESEHPDRPTRASTWEKCMGLIWSSTDKRSQNLAAKLKTRKHPAPRSHAKPKPETRLRIWRLGPCSPGSCTGRDAPEEST
ncbi:hypothetical protein DSM21852_12020 [Methylocystis bryophila]|nr:hypothetical protein DSM21852_12020 [Methylocystis bryophila]